ncbi:MAG TPA: phosphatase PAP2 family protein [Tepidisphaeraceae bacterium]
MRQTIKEPIQYLFTRRHAMALSALLVIVAGVWGLVALTDHVVEGQTQQFDSRVIDWFAAHRGPQWLQDVGRDLTAVGGVTVLTLVTIAVVGFLLISRKRGTALLMTVAVVGGLVIASVIKHFVDRPRPPRQFQAAYVFTASYPSGHSALSAVTYLTLGALLAQVVDRRVLKLYILGIAALVTFLVGMSRVYLGVHWPTDVLAGWTVGLVWALVCLIVAHELQRRGAIEREAES